MFVFILRFMLVTLKSYNVYIEIGLTALLKSCHVRCVRYVLVIVFQNCCIVSVTCRYIIEFFVNLLCL